MAGSERRHRDFMGAPVAILSFGELLVALAHDREVVERVREVGVGRTERGLLEGKGFAQQPFRSFEVADACSRFGCVDHRPGSFGRVGPLYLQNSLQPFFDRKGSEMPIASMSWILLP